MPLSAGARLGPYEVIGPLGAGGMGEVYRRLHLLGISLRDRSAARPDAASNALLMPALRSGSRGEKLAALAGRCATGTANFLNEGQALHDLLRRERS